ncbi:unnamed protein product, partial [Durusdinium trenchii]
WSPPDAFKSEVFDVTENEEEYERFDGVSRLMRITQTGERLMILSHQMMT